MHMPIHLRPCSLATALLLALVACKPDTTAAPSPAQPGQPQVLSFPDLPAPQSLAPNIAFYEVTLLRNSVPMRLWIYLPSSPPAKPIPCVLIAPAGSPLITGMALAPSDRNEHLPYARQGFAVVAYDLDGPLADNATRGQTKTAVQAFMAANAGIDNARAAIDYIGAKLPMIDSTRLYAAGHSSAATLALQLAAHDTRIAACVAYAPACDLNARLVQGRATLDSLIPNAMPYFLSLSPDQNLSTLTCPTFLFTARDDTNVPSASVTAFATALKSQNPHVTLLTVPSGGHYQSMIQQGLPAGIQFLHSQTPGGSPGLGR